MPLFFSLLKNLVIFGSTLKVGSIFMRKLVFKFFLRSSIYKGGMQVNLINIFIFIFYFILEISFSKITTK
jgi:hypothetical protein